MFHSERIAQARKLAMEARSAVADGRDPIEARRIEAAETRAVAADRTFREAAQSVHDEPQEPAALSACRRRPQVEAGNHAGRERFAARRDLARLCIRKHLLTPACFQAHIQPHTKRAMR